MLVLVSEAIWDFDLEAALKEISEQRREQALKFKFELGQRLCVLAYQLLKQGLREEYGITENPVFEYNEHGKPSIVGHPEICFNLSHCKEAVVCAVSDKPVGIDVESIREYRDSLVHYTMNDEEIQSLTYIHINIPPSIDSGISIRFVNNYSLFTIHYSLFTSPDCPRYRG